MRDSITALLELGKIPARDGIVHPNDIIALVSDLIEKANHPEFSYAETLMKLLALKEALVKDKFMPENAEYEDDLHVSYLLIAMLVHGMQIVRKQVRL